jgi:HAD superfamily, subfamily IIIB (Acid phosphatase)
MQPDGNALPAGVFKPKERQAIADKGYRIVLNIGDQASDLAPGVVRNASSNPESILSPQAAKSRSNVDRSSIGSDRSVDRP